MDENQPDLSLPEAQKPYGLGHMLEDTVCSLLRAGNIFADLAARPTPSYAVMIPNLLVFCTAACIATLLRAAVAAPELLHAAPGTMAIAAAAGTILTVPLSFLAAGVLQSFMLLSGGTGDFQRSYQATSMFSILLALQALLNWFDWAWALPALLAAYLAPAAARTLHRAPALRSGVVFYLVATICIAGQWVLREQLAHWSKPAFALQSAAATAQDLGRQVQQVQQMSLPLERGMEGANPGLPQDQTPATWITAPSSSSQPTLSGLQLLTPPAGGPAPNDPKGGTPQLQAQGQALQQSMSNLMGPVMALLNNPALTQGMTPEQTRPMKTLTSLAQQMQTDMASGKNLSSKEQAAMMAKFQRTMMQFMTLQSPISRQGLPDPGPKATKPGQITPEPKHDAANPPKNDTGSSAQTPTSQQSPQNTPN